jgi:predicted ribosomally synthesized peptide with SipW-like signal peptide
MNKKKIAALIVAGITTLGVVGGTLAWFTAKDDVTNIFKTGSVTDKKDGLDAGIDVIENFRDKNGNQITPDANGNYNYSTPVTPNETITKEVWIESTANYNQIVRARIVKNFVDPATGKVVTHWATASDGTIIFGDSTLSGGKPLNLAYIQLADNVNGTGAPTGWTIQTGANADTSAIDTTNWYYYNKIVTPHTSPDKDTHGDCKTLDILKTVTLAKEAGNEYKNLRFDVKVYGESIQAANGAIKDESVWKNVPDTIKDLNQEKAN